MLSFFCPAIRLSVCPSVHVRLSVYPCAVLLLSVCPSVHVRLSVCLSISEFAVRAPMLSPRQHASTPPRLHAMGPWVMGVSMSSSPRVPVSFCPRGNIPNPQLTFLAPIHIYLIMAFGKKKPKSKDKKSRKSSRGKDRSWDHEGGMKFESTEDVDANAGNFGS